MKIYLAAPLFTTPEREFNVRLATLLRAAGHEVFVPQENPAVERTGKAIFLRDLAGTRLGCWRCRCHGRCRPRFRDVLGVRVRLCEEEARRAVPERLPGSGDADDIPYNAMLIGRADAHIELRLGTVDEAAATIDAAWCA